METEISRSSDLRQPHAIWLAGDLDGLNRENLRHAWSAFSDE